MFSVAIISDLHDWHSAQIEYSLKKYCKKILKVSFNELSLNFKKKMISDNEFINDVDGVWVRFFNGGTLEEITTKLTILHLLRKSNIYVHNTASSIEKTVDKVRTTGLLSINKIKSPETVVYFKSKKKKPTLKKNSKYLIKPIFGSQGKNILMVNNSEELKNISPVGGVFYLQKFIDSDSSNYSDIRVLVSNHNVVSCIERSSKHFLTNVYQGANFKKIKINSKIEELSKKVSKIFNLGYGGIDLKIYKNKTYVLEVNSIPSWRAVQKIEKKNIADILVKDFIKQLKK